MNCFLVYIDYSNSGYQQNMAYGTYPQATQQAAMATSYPNYSIPSSVGSTVVYTNPSQVTAPSAPTYNYAGQTATQYVAPPPVPSYTAYQVPVAPATSAAALVPPPPMVGADAAQYGMRPPPPPPPPNQQNVSLGCCCYNRR